MNEVLISNIDPFECRKRLMMGTMMLTASLILLFFMMQSELARAWRALLFIPNFLAMLGIYQARGRTCVLRGQKGIASSEQAQIKRQIRRVYTQSLIAAALITAIFFLIST